MKPTDPTMHRRYWAFLLRRNLEHSPRSVVAFFFNWDGK